MTANPQNQLGKANMCNKWTGTHLKDFTKVQKQNLIILGRESRR